MAFSPDGLKFYMLDTGQQAHFGVFHHGLEPGFGYQVTVSAVDQRLSAIP